MKIAETKLMQVNSARPPLLAFKKIIYLRGLRHGQFDLKEIQRLERGKFGEETFFDLLQEDGCNHWVVLRNLWMYDFRSFECDFLMITNYCIYTFEIKNFRGRYVYNNASSVIEGRDMDYDPVQQARKSFLKTRSIIQKLSPTIPVKGALVFIGQKNQVSIESPINQLEILTLTDLYVTFQKIIKEEQENNHPPLNVDQIVHHLEKFEITDPFLPEPLTKQDINKMRKGIYCAQCHSFELTIAKNYVICACGLHEPREESILRMALEYGALTYDRNFTTGDIRNFIGSQASHVYIKKILMKHFDYLPNHSFSSFQNAHPLYYQSFQNFSIDLPRIYKSDREIQIFE